MADSSIETKKKLLESAKKVLPMTIHFALPYHVKGCPAVVLLCEKQPLFTSLNFFTVSS